VDAGHYNVTKGNRKQERTGEAIGLHASDMVVRLPDSR